MNYELIYADPPWQFKSVKTGGSMKSGAANQYDVMSIGEIKKLPVPDLTDKDCLLVMWWVGSQPQEALDLTKHWGFKVKNMNGFVWNKLTKNGLPHFGMGYYTRAGSESALIAIKGKPQICDHSIRAVRSAQTLAHSEKPHQFRDDCVKLAGNVKRLEMFARTNPKGWDVFGNQCDASIKI